MHRRTRLGAAALGLVLTLGSATVVTSAASAEAKTKKPTATFKNGVLTIKGTAKDQRMSVVRTKGKVTVRVAGRKVALPKGYKNRKCDEIRLKGKGGDDRLSVDPSGGPLPPVVLDGGTGNDEITGTAGVDRLVGGAGRDVLSTGAGGRDELDGGPDPDTYLVDADGTGDVRIVERYEAPGDTVSFAPTQRDVVYHLGTDALQQQGSTYYVNDDFGGIENVTGGGGDDWLHAGRDGDRVRGGGGTDELFAGSTGHAILAGDAGDDHFNLYGDSIGFTGSVRLEDSSGTDTVSFAATTSSTVQLSLGATGWQAATPQLQVQLSSATAFENLKGGGSFDFLTGNILDNHLMGGGGVDKLFQTPGSDLLEGGDVQGAVYVLDGDETADVTIVDGPGEGRVDFAATTGSGIEWDLRSAMTQHPTSTLDVTVPAPQDLTDVIGTDLDDTVTGSAEANRVVLKNGQDTFVHHGPGDGIDVFEDFNTAHGDTVSFETGGTLNASQLTLDPTAHSLTDPAGTFGVTTDYFPMLNATSIATVGTTDTVPVGQLITFNGTGAFAQGSNVDSLVASYASNGSIIGGAGARDRIIDHSPNGNSLVGRDGSDVLIAGDGADTLQGDRGFAPGVADTYTGGAGADTIVLGEAFGGGASETFGAETVTDFGTGADLVDLYTGLSVKAGLGTTSVTIWDGATDFGTVTATNGHLWTAGDFV